LFDGGGGGPREPGGPRQPDRQTGRAEFFSWPTPFFFWAGWKIIFSVSVGDERRGSSSFGPGGRPQPGLGQRLGVGEGGWSLSFGKKGGGGGGEGGGRDPGPHTVRVRPTFSPGFVRHRLGAVLFPRRNPPPHKAVNPRAGKASELLPVRGKKPGERPHRSLGPNGFIPPEWGGGPFFRKFTEKVDLGFWPVRGTTGGGRGHPRGGFPESLGGVPAVPGRAGGGGGFVGRLVDLAKSGRGLALEFYLGPKKGLTFFGHIFFARRRIWVLVSGAPF